MSDAIEQGTDFLAADKIGALKYQLMKVAFGDDDQAVMVSAANPLPVDAAFNFAPSENHLGAVGGHSAVVTATFNRPADVTQYTIGDLVANNPVAANVTPMQLTVARINGQTGCIRRARLGTNHVGLAGTDIFRVHFFDTAPTPVNGDNSGFSVNGVAAGYLGFCDITLDRIFSDGAKGIGVPAVGGEITFDTGAGTTDIFALIEARSAYTPANGETFTLALEVFRD